MCISVFMYLSERYLEALQNVDVEEPKSQQQKNGKCLLCLLGHQSSTRGNYMY